MVTDHGRPVGSGLSHVWQCGAPGTQGAKPPDCGAAEAEDDPAVSMARPQFRAQAYLATAIR